MHTRFRTSCTHALEKHVFSLEAHGQMVRRPWTNKNTGSKKCPKHTAVWGRVTMFVSHWEPYLVGRTLENMVNIRRTLSSHGYSLTCILETSLRKQSAEFCRWCTMGFPGEVELFNCRIQVCHPELASLFNGSH